MALQTVTAAWSAGIVLAAKTVVQCRAGQVRIETGAAPGADDGIVLNAGDVLIVDTGLTLYWRGVSPNAAINTTAIGA